ncbi:MAG TPA: type II toxin-antitoxin system Phd/YefM family antitoxin [Marmoricola sp.]|nr:type II toxin-antitoxin system Phd/YefM family antitoxin [Nocardioidaceae bacterium]MCB8993207.1 type II toxin-antitoxin system Phd/YefM family antitoxin [Nocardioidaceae bacterium]MCO5323135.1 type II toxin-antitoxin system Phd/YefM family antitoxin [Nocardioidaceae bacterium]HRV69724.1 type II toxin-antitoxin system Phd/YefM family antitoxin [Marmoricola sp.]
MATLSSSDARKNFADTVRRSQTEPVVIERRGRREAVMLAPEEFDRLVEAAEELDDIAAFDAAMSEEGENIPWDELKAELGWV